MVKFAIEFGLTDLEQASFSRITHYAKMASWATVVSMLFLTIIPTCLCMCLCGRFWFLRFQNFKQKLHKTRSQSSSAKESVEMSSMTHQKPTKGRKAAVLSSNAMDEDDSKMMVLADEQPRITEKTIARQFPTHRMRSDIQINGHIVTRQYIQLFSQLKQLHNEIVQNSDVDYLDSFDPKTSLNRSGHRRNSDILSNWDDITKLYSVCVNITDELATAVLLPEELQNIYFKPRTPRDSAHDVELKSEDESELVTVRQKLGAAADYEVADATGMVLFAPVAILFAPFRTLASLFQTHWSAPFIAISKLPMLLIMIPMAMFPAIQSWAEEATKIVLSLRVLARLRFVSFVTLLYTAGITRYAIDNETDIALKEYLLGLLSVICVYGMTFALNQYYNSDIINPDTGLRRTWKPKMRPPKSKKYPIHPLLALSYFLAITALIVSRKLFYGTDKSVASVLLIVSLLLAHQYSCPPIRACRTFLSELWVGIIFNSALVLFGYFLPLNRRAQTWAEWYSIMNGHWNSQFFRLIFVSWVIEHARLMLVNVIHLQQHITAHQNKSKEPSVRQVTSHLRKRVIKRPESNLIPEKKSKKRGKEKVNLGLKHSRRLYVTEMVIGYCLLVYCIVMGWVDRWSGLLVLVSTIPAAVNVSYMVWNGITDVYSARYHAQMFNGAWILALYFAQIIPYLSYHMMRQWDVGSLFRLCCTAPLEVISMFMQANAVVILPLLFALPALPALIAEYFWAVRRFFIILNF